MPSRYWRSTVSRSSTISPKATITSYSLSFPTFRFSVFWVKHQLQSSWGNPSGPLIHVLNSGWPSRSVHWCWAWWSPRPQLVRRRLHWTNPNCPKNLADSPNCTLLNAIITLLHKESEAERVRSASLYCEEAADGPCPIVQFGVFVEEDVANLFDSSEVALGLVAFTFREVFVAEGRPIGISISVELRL